MARALLPAIGDPQEFIAVSAVAPEGEPNRSAVLRTNKFPRSARLLRHADFERVYKLGRRHFSASMIVFYLPRQQAQPANQSSPGCRIGFTVGRALGGAVVRNRMKRRLREAVRLSRPGNMPDVDVVINPKKNLLTADFSSVLNEVARAFVVIEEKLRKTEAPGRTPESESRTPKAGSRIPNA